MAENNLFYNKGSAFSCQRTQRPFLDRPVAELSTEIIGVWCWLKRNTKIKSANKIHAI